MKSALRRAATPAAYEPPTAGRAAVARASRAALWVLCAVAGATFVASCTSGGPSSSAAASRAGSAAASGQSSAASAPARASVQPVPTPTGTQSGAPTPGNLTATVPPRKLTTLSPVPLNGTANYGGGLHGEITRVQAIQAKAQLPGEVAGPAVAITFRLTNKSGHSVSMDSVVTNISDATGRPGSPISSSPNDPLRGRLSAGKSATGVYVFTIPLGHRSPVTVTISSSPTAPLAQFIGAVK